MLVTVVQHVMVPEFWKGLAIQHNGCRAVPLEFCHLVQMGISTHPNLCRCPFKLYCPLSVGL